MNIKMDKHGWLKIIESFIAIILLMGIVLIVLNDENTKKEDVSSEFYNIERGILKEIQLDTTLREEIVGSTGEIGLDDTNFPALTKTKIEDKIPTYIACTAKICSPADLCILTDEQITNLGLEEKDIYAESMMITSTLQTFNPRVIKLFCWD